MGKVKRNYKDVDRTKREQYSGDVPKPGIYDFFLKSVEDHTGGDAEGEKLVWMFECTQEPYAGFAAWVYTNDSSTAWKEVQILEATGLLAEGETELDMTHEQMVKKAGPVRCKIINETYEEEKRGKIKTVLPPRDGQDKPSGKGSSGKKKGKKDKSPF